MSRILVVLALFMLMPAPTAAAATQQVHMSGYAYGPGTLTINVGDTVTWTNHDQAPHDAVTTAGPAQFRSPMLNTGQTWSFTFTTPGTYSYYCSVHPDMRGQIVVRQAAQAPTPQQQQQPAPSQRRQSATPAPRTQQTSAVVVPEPVEGNACGATTCGGGCARAAAAHGSRPTAVGRRPGRGCRHVVPTADWFTIGWVSMVCG
ncbi:cupredoxin domain-containing protein [Kibdelosporangium aridum]|uniref:cupredoxin domain-containing protein n=1 Tax=Kibdelosporangium aridum TaxID=2030 RepID=UPI0035EB1BF8